MKNEKIIRLLLEMLELDSSEYVRLMVSNSGLLLLNMSVRSTNLLMQCMLFCPALVFLDNIIFFTVKAFHLYRQSLVFRSMFFKGLDTLGRFFHHF